jgi:hypothetical protein
MKTLFALALGSLCAVAFDGPVREITSQAARAGNVVVPAFQNGYIFVLDRATVQLFAREGYLAFVAALQVPNGTNPSAQGLAVDSDGSVAVSVACLTQTGLGGGIVFLDKGGLPAGFMDTGSYMPGNLSYGEDHLLWAIGWQRDAVSSNHPDRQDYMVVRKYARDRKEAGRYLARSLFPKGLEPGFPRWQRLRIAVAHERVGLLAWSGENSSQSEWVELNLDGSLIRRVRMERGDDPNTHLAYTSDGRLFRQTFGSGNLQVLDQNTPEWKIAGSSPGKQLMGADGTLLVFSNSGLGPINLQWFEPPVTSAEK